MITSLIAPEPDADPHEAPAVAEHVQVAPVREGGMESETVAPTTDEGPELLTVIV